ncbi:hypothetical protein D3C72_643460 [compost metagenome]
MNIFVLHEDPCLAAKDQCDRHVVKMVTESAQILSSVRHRYGAPAPYRPTHANHPCVLWAGNCAENYAWLVTHMAQLLAEYTERYGKTHAVQAHLETLREPPAAMPRCGERQPFTQCMPEHYRLEGDPVTAYRHFYMGEKSGFAKWKLGNVPSWYRPDTFVAASPPPPPEKPKAPRARKPKVGYIGRAKLD